MTTQEEYYNKLSEIFSSSDLALLTDYQLEQLWAYRIGRWGKEVSATRHEFLFEGGSAKLINSATGRLLWSCPMEDRYRPELHDPSRYSRPDPLAAEPWPIRNRTRLTAKRLGVSTVDYAALGEIAERVKSDAEVAELALEPDFEVIKSGSNPPLPYPAARTSTVSGTIILNRAMIDYLRDSFQQIPEGVTVLLAERGTRVGLQFHVGREPGDYTLGLATEFNRGYTIHCGQVVQALIRAAEAKARNSHDHGSDPGEHQAAADLVYGRRRLVRTPSGLWTFSLNDPRV